MIIIIRNDDNRNHDNNKGQSRCGHGLKISLRRIYKWRNPKENMWRVVLSFPGALQTTSSVFHQGLCDVIRDYVTSSGIVWRHISKHSERLAFDLVFCKDNRKLLRSSLLCVAFSTSFHFICPFLSIAFYPRVNCSLICTLRDINRSMIRKQY